MITSFLMSTSASNHPVSLDPFYHTSSLYALVLDICLRMCDVDIGVGNDKDHDQKIRMRV